MLGPGKYDSLCTKVREEAKAAGAIVLIFDGEKGSGFSCQATLEITNNLANMLRSMADQIESSVPFATQIAESN
jgi:hypothetical protein